MQNLVPNTIAQSGPTLVGYFASFVSAPFVLESLGLKGFGIWALTGALAQYAGLLDFGVGPTLSRFVALYDAQGDDHLVGEVIGTGLLTSAAVLCVLTLVSLVGAAPLAHSVHLSSVSEMRVLLLSATVIFSVVMLTNVLTAYHIGVQEMIGPNVALTLGVVLNFALSMTAALTSHSLERYAVANALASGLALGVVVVFFLMSARKRVRLRLPRSATARVLLHYSVRNQALTASSLVNFQTDKIVIALFIGPAAAGAYELANRVAAAARSFGVLAVGAMTPSMTAATFQLSSDRLSDLYLQWTARSAALGVPPLLFVAAMPNVILHAWLGAIPSDSAVVLAVLSLGYVVNTTTAVGYSLASARGDPGLPARSAVLTAIGNLAATVALAPVFGLYGVLTGTAAAFTAGSLYQVLLVHRRYSIPLQRYVRAVKSVLLLSAALALPLFAANLAARYSDRLVQSEVLVGGGVCFIIAYAYGASSLSLLPASVDRILPWRIIASRKGV